MAEEPLEIVRHLPQADAAVGVPARAQFGGGQKRPRTAADLEAAGLIAPAIDPWRYFHQHRGSVEVAIAVWLRAHGVEVRSVGVGAYRTPDAVLVGAGQTVEFKSVGPDAADPAESIYQRLRHARAQSSRVVVDAQRTRVTRDGANAAIVRVLRNGGLDLLELVVLGPGFVLSWP